MWTKSYIVPSVLLWFISYMGLFIGNHNPGRPGVHALTIVRPHSPYQQLPAACSADGWIVWPQF
jgi:hypothetical protein